MDFFESIYSFRVISDSAHKIGEKTPGFEGTGVVITLKKGDMVNFIKEL